MREIKNSWLEDKDPDAVHVDSKAFARSWISRLWQSFHQVCQQHGLVGTFFRQSQAGKEPEKVHLRQLAPRPVQGPLQIHSDPQKNKAKYLHRSDLSETMAVNRQQHVSTLTTNPPIGSTTNHRNFQTILSKNNLDQNDKTRHSQNQQSVTNMFRCARIPGLRRLGRQLQQLRLWVQAARV